MQSVCKVRQIFHIFNCYSEINLYMQFCYIFFTYWSKLKYSILYAFREMCIQAA